MFKKETTILPSSIGDHGPYKTMWRGSTPFHYWNAIAPLRARYAPVAGGGTFATMFVDPSSPQMAPLTSASDDDAQPKCVAISEIRNNVSTASAHDMSLQDQESYAELEQGLVELKSDEDWRIDDGVYGRAIQVAAMIMSKMIPPPELFTHSPTSVVFSWEGDKDKQLYLTIGENRIAILLKTVFGGTRRAEIEAANTSVTDAFFSALTPTDYRTPPLLLRRTELQESSEG